MLAARIVFGQELTVSQIFHKEVLSLETMFILWSTAMHAVLSRHIRAAHHMQALQTHLIKSEAAQLYKLSVRGHKCICVGHLKGGTLS